MRALTWHGKHDIRCESVPDPSIEAPTDAIIKVTSCAICGSDLHLYNGVIPDMHSGDVLGHENMGEVVEVGSSVSNLKVGDRVVVPFVIACGECFFCKRGAFSGCERSNPQKSKEKAETMCGDTRRLAFLATRTSSAASLAARRSIFACPTPMWGRSRCRRV
jgi:threonine dehydrogenase-like Zn-dependent dehydrogenase